MGGDKGKIGKEIYDVIRMWFTYHDYVLELHMHIKSQVIECEHVKWANKVSGGSWLT
jgi:hypothetical protein